MTYRRAIYEVVDENGLKRYVYLLDETLELENIGLISMNMADLLVSSITELSYRGCAEKVSAMTGQSISAMGVWNVIIAIKWNARGGGKNIKSGETRFGH